MTFRDSLGNTWLVHRQRVPAHEPTHDLIVIECERPIDPVHPSYAAIPTGDVASLIAALRIVGGERGDADEKGGPG